MSRWSSATLALATGLSVCLTACSDEAKPGPAVGGQGKLVISEIMYHPVLDQGSFERHEFVELENAGSEAVDLGNYRISGGIRFAFAPGTQLAPGAFLVVAKRRADLLALPGYALQPAQVVGDFAGSLSNDGDTVVLERVVGGVGTVVDQVTYDDGFPWPMAADALGAGESWLGRESLPLSAHRFMGRSLERRSSSEAGGLVSNWTASPLDGATPGKAPTERGGLLPTVTAVATIAAGQAAAVLPPDVAVSVRVAITPDLAAQPEIEYFVDDLDKQDEPTTRVALAPGTAGQRSATLPAFPSGTLLRYRVWGDRGGGPEVLSPRPDEPFAFHNAYVNAPIAGTTPAYQLLISKAHWEQLFDNIIDGRVPGNQNGGNPVMCEINPRWDARVPAVLVAGGRVFDIQTRYQGSRTNRTGGPRLFDRMKWPPMGAPAMSIPSHVTQPLSWHFKFPRHARLEGKETINLNKLTDAACQGFFARVGNILFEQAGIAAAETSYARLYVNGHYYHYMQRLEHVDEDMLARAYGPGHKIGDLFKSVGVRWDEGPFGFGDEGPLSEHCGYSVQERYDATYERQSLKDEREGSDEVRALIEEFQQARAGGVLALRKFFSQNFDLELLTNYMVVRNWLGAWDDIWQNHFLYRKADGRWMVLPTDLDNHFGFSLPSAVDASFFAGIDNGRSNFRELSSPLKDGFLRAYRQEFIARLQQLSGSVLHPSNVWPLIDEAVADYQVEEAKAAPAGLSQASVCGAGNPVMVGARMKAFVGGRYERVLDGLFD